MAAGWRHFSLRCLRSTSNVQCIKKNSTDSPLPFPNQGNQLADFFVRIVDIYFISNEHG
jgi:hypothetical protein